MNNKHYILKGKTIIEVDLMTWAKWFESNIDRIIKQEELPDGTWLSTVFLGLDHNFGFSKKPLLFETMLFTKKGGEEVDIARCSTYKEAKEQHEEMLRQHLHAEI